MIESHITQAQADEYAIGALEPGLERIAALHLAECAVCRDIVHDSERLAFALSLAAPRRKAPRHIRHRVFRAAGITRPGPLHRAYVWGRAVAGVAAVFVAIAAFTGMVSVRGQIGGLRDTNAELQAQIDDALAQKVEIALLTQRLGDEEAGSAELREATRNDRDLLLAMLSPASDIADVVSVSPTSPSIGRLVWDDEQRRIWFIATSLAPLPEGKTYQIWVSSEGRFTSLGTFTPDAAGFARYETFLPQGLKQYDSAVVTVERGGALERSGPSVFVTDLSQFGR
ncbi:MAG: anti-sigma factor domain-containing protein [Tepidiformaceae bacterium]